MNEKVAIWLRFGAISLVKRSTLGMVEMGGMGPELSVGFRLRAQSLGVLHYIISQALTGLGLTFGYVT